MDEKPLTLEAVKDAYKESHSQDVALKREVDSVDDFEHLGHHDVSPVKGLASEGDMTKADTRDVVSAINNSHSQDELWVKTAPVVTDNLLDQPLATMDSNLVLEASEHKFPDRKEADDKLDKFLEEMSAPFTATSPQEKAIEEKYNYDHFMDNERDLLQPVTTPAPAKDEDLADHYSDSEPEEDDFKPSKYDNFPKKIELPESFGSVENFKADTFKDVQEPEPQPPREKTPEPVRMPDKIPVKVNLEQPPPKKPAEQPPLIKKPTEQPPEKPKLIHTTDAEAIFCKMGLDAWFNPERLNPKVESLIYWRDPKKSGIVFGGVLVILLSLTYFSLLSVVAYLSLLVLAGTIAFRIYKNVIQAVQKTGDGHPFKELLEADVSLPQDKVKEITEVAVAHVNAVIVELRRLFLVEDLVDSLKFAVVLWTFKNLGALFNGMTLIIIVWVALFSLPKVYETNKAQIDANLEIVRIKLDEIKAKIKAAIPIGRKAEEKKEQ